MIEIDRNVMWGQCKNTLLRVQIRHTAVFFGVGWISGWVGSQIGLFTPRKTEEGYSCTGFYFLPWLYPDIPVCQIPNWYRKPIRAISFRFGE